MTFPCVCPSCGYVNHAEWSEVGQETGCRGCGRTWVVPAPRETTGESGRSSALMVRFRCPACRRKFATRPGLAGKKIRCTGCGAGVRVPEGDEDTGVPPSRPALPTGVDAAAATDRPRPARGLEPSAFSVRARAVDGAGDSSPMLEDLASIEGVKPSRRAGTSLTSRSSMMEKLRQKADEEAVATREKAEKSRTKKKKKRKKQSGYFDTKETLSLVAGVGVLVVVLALLAWGYPGLRFPLGGSLCVIGFIVYVLGAISIRQLVAEEGFVKLLLFRFCPPYQWWFVATNWAETRDFVAFFGAGLMIMSIGGTIIKTSPIGKKAEAADRAYQKAKQGGQADVRPASSGFLDVE